MTKGINCHIQTMERGSWKLPSPLHVILQAGQALVLRGPNGSGKSSVLLALSTLLPFEGSYLSPPSCEKIRFKSPYRDGLDDITVEKHLRFWRYVYEACEEDLEERLSYYHLHPYKTIPLSQLSYGTNHRVGLARLGLGASDIWLMDEPFAGLDEASCQLVKEDIAVALKKGKTIVMACHHNPMGLPEMWLG